MLLNEVNDPAYRFFFCRKSAAFHHLLVPRLSVCGVFVCVCVCVRVVLGWNCTCLGVFVVCTDMDPRARTRGLEDCLYLVIKCGVEEDAANVSDLTEHEVARMQLGFISKIARV